MFPRPKAREKVRTWVKSQWKFTSPPGQFSAVINKGGVPSGSVARIDLVKQTVSVKKW